MSMNAAFESLFITTNYILVPTIYLFYYRFERDYNHLLFHVFCCPWFCSFFIHSSDELASYEMLLFIPTEKKTLQ